MSARAPISAPAPSPAIMTASPKHSTEIGAGAFIGSDTALVAPVKVGAGAITAAGSVITKDVAPTRWRWRAAQQTEKPGWAKAFRESKARREKTIMCGIVGIAGTRGRGAGHSGSAEAAGISRLRFRRHRHPGGRPDRAPPLARQAVQAGRGAARRSRCPARPASATRAGPPMARRPRSNAHPHATARVAIVHNGIIENFRELRDELIAKGHKFESQTDSEVAAHLVTDNLDQGMTPDEAAKAAVARLTGAYSIAMIFKDHEGLLIGARKGAPLAVGYADERSLSRLRRFRAGALHQPRRLSGRRRCRGDRQGARFRSSTPRAVPPIARSRSPRPPPLWSTRAATAISWPRKSTSSRK